MFEAIPQFCEPNADAVRLRVSEQADRTTVECAWPGRSEPDALQNARVTISQTEVTVERRCTPRAGAPAPWKLIHRSAAHDLAPDLPSPVPPALRLTAALMIALDERARDVPARP